MTAGDTPLSRLAATRSLGALLEALGDAAGGYELLHHWKQGEFHHDVVVRLSAPGAAGLPGPVLVVATNCNGGVKELLCLGEVPERDALWLWRCPDALELGPAASMPPVLARATTEHWFDPCELLAPDARSELLPEHRRRQRGGGWEPR